ncbi:uncharacterized protein LOC115335294 [Aquila chrysaetos chrysaetos]|uniref:uncharacterized protein LOC115335294 n=1 Tax=Aquila chrysaetos chrysaetos TaxID=223781 RepID=UPI001176A97F|nr:uncharacterized protein LOC115335294 [Aquila chrysaetos chrysaetos]
MTDFPPWVQCQAVIAGGMLKPLKNSLCFAVPPLLPGPGGELHTQCGLQTALSSMGEGFAKKGAGGNTPEHLSAGLVLSGGGDGRTLVRLAASDGCRDRCATDMVTLSRAVGSPWAPRHHHSDANRAEIPTLAHTAASPELLLVQKTKRDSKTVHNREKAASKQGQAKQAQSHPSLENIWSCAVKQDGVRVSPDATAELLRGTPGSPSHASIIWSEMCLGVASGQGLFVNKLSCVFFQQKPPASLLLPSKKQLPCKTAFTADQGANHFCDGFTSAIKPSCSPCIISVRF